MRINYNVSAMLANNNLANNDDLLSRSLQRLSSGLKINNAKDNPAGLAMAKRMNAQIEGVGIASRNASEAISVIETADGALNEVADMLHRMTELSIEAANGTMTDEDRDVIQKEVSQLKSEITRVCKTTEFNSQPLLNGFYDLKAYTDDNKYKVTTYSQDIPVSRGTIDSLSWTPDPATGEMQISMTMGTGFPPGATEYKGTMVDNVISIIGPQGYELSISVPDNEAFDASGNPIAGSLSNLTIDFTGLGPMRMQIGANEGQVLEMAIPAISLQNMGLERLDVSTEKGAQDAIERIENALSFLSNVRGKLGAYENRLEHTTASLDIMAENMTSAYSGIMDVDMAEEMTRYSTYTVMTQAGISVLSQANDRPSQVLQLLQ